MPKLCLLLALYFVQGLPFGFQASALPIYLRTHGVSLSAIGFAGALALPWLLKALWAPLVDRYHTNTLGRRKSWILPMQFCLALTCALASTLDPSTDLTSLLFLVFCMNLFAATQDIAVDGLAVDLLREDELGPGNAAQVVGYKLGMLTGGGLLVWLSDSIGWQGLFLCMAILISVVWIIVFLYREPVSQEHVERAGESFKAIFAALKQSLQIPKLGWIFLAIATYKMGESMIDRMFTPFLVDAGFGAGQIGLWVGSYGMVFSILGSLSGGLLASRLPILSALFITATLRIIPLAGECLLTLVEPSATHIILVTCAEHFFGGALTTAMFAFMMSKVDKRIGATHFTLLAALEVLGKSPSTWLSGVLADALGYTMLFAFGTLLSALFVLFLLPLRQARAP